MWVSRSSSQQPPQENYGSTRSPVSPNPVSADHQISPKNNEEEIKTNFSGDDFVPKFDSPPRPSESPQISPQNIIQNGTNQNSKENEEMFSENDFVINQIIHGTQNHSPKSNDITTDEDLEEGFDDIFNKNSSKNSKGAKLLKHSNTNASSKSNDPFDLMPGFNFSQI